jgi:hypothetical protein
MDQPALIITFFCHDILHCSSCKNPATMRIDLLAFSIIILASCLLYPDIEVA